MSIAVYTKNGGKSSTTVKLDKKIFGLKPERHDLLHQSYRGYLTNTRQNNAKAKTRADVSGGGKKPYPQKGTGRARFGSSRNPIWRGGGVAFGPTGSQNFKLKLNQKAKRLAIRQALSLAASEGRLKIVEDFIPVDGKVKPTVELLTKIEAQGRVLVVVDQPSELARRATQNIENLKLVRASHLSTFDLVNADWVVMTKPSLAVIDKWLGESK
ncbi:50S ribosomal protein L4 [Candidatus Saccharibacteria bacterium RIFCSPLOWO2_01_FULL_48_13]|nr:MAG: 50S ribosomal protein L4 [Candidatus Saccharibacteria bacterium RIFCSPHIGHO2_01_FULL_48_12]OGL35338.1 MAG: 50S ribosomal protein L4 [Candidatus Saccharibacteria bacterium RIFCSPHIGHO2_12_FULL_48_21]OGL37572.1 MAG: 50S ribosomal protein L4 [Candidatus Saccharibacteria bacterium RIFCSPLOWO2_01_FULL_48_13]